MCGILLYLNKKKNLTKKEIRLISKTSKLLYHRGPDFQKSIIKKNIFLFHSRLSIQDLNSRSNQPMTVNYKDNKYHLLFNGEIYNFKELKNQISKKIKFQTTSDTEVLIKNFIFKKENPEFIMDFEGMFAFTIYNEKNNSIIFGRDFFGQKPLYYFSNNDKIIISSEIKPILKLISPQYKKINKQSIKEYFLENDYFKKRQTLFKNISLILPGEIGYIINNQIFFKRLYSNIKLNKNKSKKNYIDYMKKNIINHTISDKKISISLSSGLDSSLIAHVIYTNYKNKYNLTAYTYDFEGESYEYKKAKKFTDSYNKKIKKVLITKDYLINNFEKFVKANEGPIGGIAQFGLFKVCDQAKKDGFDVILSGFGLDECFGSYKSIKKKIKSKSFELIDSKIISNEAVINKDKFSNISKKINDYFFKIKIPRTTHMVDRSSMYHSIEMRLPFLERKFVEKSVSMINKSEKIDKSLIRNYMQKNCKSKNNWLSPKVHVPHPQNSWLKKGKFSNWVENLLYDNFLYKKVSFLNKKKVISKWKEFKNSDNENASGYLFWQLINLYFFVKNFSR